MKEKIISTLTVCLYLILIADYGVGFIHSFKKHGTADGIIGTILFPWAMYRGVESFFHNDYSGVDWDKRLDTDMKNCIYFITEGTADETNVYKLNEDLDEFSAKISAYPKDKRQFLMDGCRKYITYLIGIIDEQGKHAEGYYRTGNYSFTKSPSTQKLELELVNTFKLKDNIDLINTAFDEQSKQLKEVGRNDLLEYEIAEYMAKFESGMNLFKTKYDRDAKKIFKGLFNEEF
jgi:hypothetical protein